MVKLQDLFTQAHRAQNSGGIGFLGRHKSESKPHAAALVVRFPDLTPGYAEAVLKAGADGLLFTWNGKEQATLETLKTEIASAASNNEQLVTGLQITGGWNTLNQDSFTTFKELGIQYIVLPFDAPARLLALESKEIEKVVTVPSRSGEMYPLFIRNLTAFDGIAAVLLDFGLTNTIGSLTIEEVLHYRAVREAVRFPALVTTPENLDEAGAYTISTIGVQAVVLTASENEEATRQKVKALRETLEKIHPEEKESTTPSLGKL